MWMIPEDIILSEIRQTEKDKNCVVSLVCVILTKSQPRMFFIILYEQLLGIAMLTKTFNPVFLTDPFHFLQIVLKIPRQKLSFIFL